ncbi:MAG TPA: PP2C family serine/threonine-protein phosphatase [Nevskia sp.]|nr:PP2C family serine/threonine-protein phosphatase [Nevskia sp.]
MSAAPRGYRSAGRTDVGKLRGHNEDALLIRDDLGLWVVADGLGGHAAGDVASALIVERLAALSRTGTVHDFIEAIEDALIRTNDDLRQAALERRVDLIGSTVALLVHHDAFMLCGWVGDSRVYAFEGNRLRQVTRDHAQGGVDDTDYGRRRPVPAGNAVLTRAIGAEERLAIDWLITGHRPGMQFLLCSDGVNKELADAELEAAFRSPASPPELIEHIVETSLARGARDNVTAIVVRLGS